ncbi:hypothetical protein QFC20_006524 [Naganishia adeliensis]|uniref:Uncharacterized protein n=1 Tax=Naganishia adeliensis TaxID=92952 RepID=A0ACC2V9Z7_9TREE|nr:hypothetical protein QFC20_006524 [Naganishia adeliensis]
MTGEVRSQLGQDSRRQGPHRYAIISTARKAPIMVAGMTTCTMPAGFIAAVLDTGHHVGHHVKLAGGADYKAKALQTKVADNRSLIEYGASIALNA